MNSIFIYGRMFNTDNGDMYEIMQYYPIKAYYTQDKQRYINSVKHKLCSMAKNHGIKHYSVFAHEVTRLEYEQYYDMKLKYDC